VTVTRFNCNKDRGLGISNEFIRTKWHDASLEPYHLSHTFDYKFHPLGTKESNMGKLLDEIGPSEEAFIGKQTVFFVATAPLSECHHVNVSPKAPGSSLVVLSPHKVAYIDLTGSGAETAAHVLENGRMTIMFCNLEDGPPKILRLHGTASMIVREDADPTLLEMFPVALTQNPGFRSVFVLTVDRISSSCGYSLPIMTYQKTRSTLDEYAERKGTEGMKDYCLYKNSYSIDGLPSVAQLRNPDVIIGAKPEEGYIYGEIISRQTPLTVRKLVPYSTQRKETSLTLKSTLAIVLLGTIAFLAGSIFALEILPLFLPELTRNSLRVVHMHMNNSSIHSPSATEL
jgi:Pyridoxamine 5'-phosphate oxidase